MYIEDKVRIDCFHRGYEQGKRDTALTVYEGLCINWSEMKEALLINDESIELKNLIYKIVGMKVE